MSEFEIRKGIPRAGKFKAIKNNYNLEAMQVDDCMVVPEADKKRLSNAKNNFKASHPGWDFTLRHVGSEVRLWCDARPDSKPAAAIAPTPAPVNPRAQLKARLDDAWDEDRTPASSSDASGVASRLREAAKLTQPGARTVVRR